MDGPLSRNEVYLKATTFLCRPVGNTCITLFSPWWVLEISRISLALDQGAVESANQLHIHHLTDPISVLGLFLLFLLLVIHVDPTRPLPWRTDSCSRLLFYQLGRHEASEVELKLACCDMC